MILVAATATAMGLAIHQVCFPPIPLLERMTSISNTLQITKLVVASVLLYWTVALLILRFRQPRPPWRRLRRQAGFLACLAILFAVLNQFALGAHVLFVPSANQRFHVRGFILGLAATHLIAPAVVTAWVTLAVSGGWKPAADWVDSLGRLIGMTWLMLYGLSLVVEYTG